MNGEVPSARGGDDVLRSSQNSAAQAGVLMLLMVRCLQHWSAGHLLYPQNSFEAPLLSDAGGAEIGGSVGCGDADVEIAGVGSGGHASAEHSFFVAPEHGMFVAINSITVLPHSIAGQSPNTQSIVDAQHSVTVHDAESHAVVVERFVCVEASHKLAGALAHTSFAVQHSLVSV
jgi:hypothetical protein